jgi:undecaprenyl-diphosphatase
MKPVLRKILRWDAEWSRRIRLPTNTPFWHRFFSFFAHSGDSWFWLIGLLVVWGLGSPQWHMRAAYLAFALSVEAVFVLWIKFTVRRRRPDGEWGAIYRNTDPHSFPSGHAARAALLAVLAMGMGPVWFGWVVVIWAPLVCLARVIMGVHYLSDVVAGFALGLLSGVLALAAQAWVVQQVNSFVPFIFQPF